MTRYVPVNCDQPFLLLLDLKDWPPENDLVHCIVAAMGRVQLRANRQADSKPRYHPRLILTLLATALPVACSRRAGSSGLCAELGITRQTLYRHVDPNGRLRPDGEKLLDGMRLRAAAVPNR